MSSLMCTGGLTNVEIIQMSLSNRHDLKDCFRFFEGTLNAALLSIPFWTIMIYIIL